ncbi:MAG TPA: 16S rRNA (adenine(1518)-N(6)/adenine(1519)-N(6))-dimethyltransferase RsmA [Pyrinomonadaceae bacterium]|jgi:16S rRNA (adenine1518-N6/adenine1519-N6)-dimethyltransferase
MFERNVPFAKRSFGQNFLVDHDFVEKIVAAVRPTSDDTIVEIGSGRGALTEELVKNARRVIAIELERDMVTLLDERFSGDENFQLLAADALKVNFAELSPGETLKLVANLPYNVSTAILQRLIKYRHSFSEMVLMFQREVVDRIAARPGNTDRGYLTVLVEAYLESERLFDVPPAAFRPSPKVWSSVVRLRPKPDKPKWPDDRFKRLVSAGFLQKRKTLQNNLRSSAAALGLDPERITDLLLVCNIEPSRRAETLTLSEWECLALKLD